MLKPERSQLITFKVEGEIQQGSDTLDSKKSNNFTNYQHSAHPLVLLLSFFIDWFNPLGNKLAGNQVLLGVITFTCFNLPPSMQYKPHHTYLSGITPLLH
ncbi:hypothetical protein VP01_5969g1 [Puccinia sorghi]|uniref:Uncharacterized protein n=1 Tax=Puccinia sorghi TaxID=27349 RepID=A0A0L6UHL3_9BASI|nr:hypothetical protein VP01_5969g1 [Puccinia sorghi]